LCEVPVICLDVRCILLDCHSIYALFNMQLVQLIPLWPRWYPQTLQRLGDWLNVVAFQAPSAPVILVGSHKDELESEDTQLREAQTLVRGHLEGMYIKQMGIIEQICQPPKKDNKLQWFFAVDSKSRETIAGKGLQSSDPVMGQIRKALHQAVIKDNRKVKGLSP